MSTSLATLRQLLSADVGDILPGIGSCSSTTTSSGSTTTLIDSALIPVPVEYFRTGSGGEPPAYVYITSGTYSGTVRAISSFTASTGTITWTTAAGGTIGSSVTWELHRLGDPKLKEWCVQQACYDAFPYLYSLVDDQTIHFGDWLIDGHMNDWSSSSAMTCWTASGATLERTSSTSFGGTYVCGLKTGTGYVGQSVTNNASLMELAGQRVHFYARVKTSTASQMRLAIYDGTTTTYSDYHAGGGGWQLLDVEADIADHPTDVAFRVYYDSVATTGLVTDCAVYGPDKYNYDISYLDIVNSVPNQIYLMDAQSDEFTNPLSFSTLCHFWKPLGSGKIEFTQNVEGKMRILGMKNITQPDSSTSTDVDAPQTGIVSALAAVRLFKNLKQNAPSHSVGAYAQLETDWEAESRRRIARYGMKQLPINRTQYA